MTGKRRLVMWTATLAVAGLIVAAILLTHPHTRPMTLRGAVIREDADPDQRTAPGRRGNPGALQ